MSVSASSSIDASTRYCAVFGHPIQHSASPAMQNAGIERLGLNWRYLAFDVPPNTLGDAIQGARTMQFVGLNLTVPHKLLAMDSVDILDDSANEWGAVNTIRFEGRRAGGDWVPVGLAAELEFDETRSHGFNTDAEAIVRSIQEDLGLALADRSVLVLGAGGAGRVAALKLAASRVRCLFLVNRTESKAREVADEIRRRSPGVEVSLGYPNGAVDLVVNATSLGLKAEDPLPVDGNQFRFEDVANVYDMIYRPAETPLLQKAREAGCRTANGLGMLLYQGAKALEIWTQRTAPIDVMKAALEQHVYQN